ncbi:hypothetical protein JCM10207_005614 [Rhodosporidiobolus poonsookiae]
MNTEKSPPTYNAQQPAPAQPMTVGAAPAPAHLVGNGQGGEREWSTGLCACGDDVGGFCLSCWCPCISFGQYKQRLDALKNEGRALPKEQVETCGQPGLLFLAINCIAGAGWILDFMARDEIRKRYRIGGGACGDCLKTCCCLPCAQRQHHRELRREEEAQWGAMGGAATGQGQQPMGGEFHPNPV